MAYKSGHIYLIDHEPTGAELDNFTKPVQFDVCQNGKFYSILYDKNGNRFIEDRSQVVTGFIKIGPIVQSGDQINIGVHPSGFNHWRINGIDVTSSSPSVLQLGSVSSGNFRIDNIVGNSAGGLFILPGYEGKYPIEQNMLDYPSFAFLVKVLITPEGLDVDLFDHVISVGNISSTSTQVTLALHESGKNAVMISGIEYFLTVPSIYNFAAVTGDNIKVLVIYALPDSTVFHLAEGLQGLVAVEPTLPENALIVRRIIVTADAQLIDPEVLSGFKEKAEDNWKVVYSNKTGNFPLQYNDARTSFQLDTTTPSNIDRTVNEIIFSSETERDIEFVIKNNTLGKVTIVTGVTDGLSKGFTADNLPYVINSKASVFVKYNRSKDALEVLKVGNTDVQSIYTDATLEGLGISGSPLKLSATKNAEIAGKVGKTTDSVTAPTAALYYVYLANSDNTIFMRMNLTNYMTGYATTTALSNKIDKVPGTGYRLAQLNPDGTISAAAVATAVPVYVYGESASGSLTKYGTTTLAITDTRGSGFPTLAEMNTTYAGKKIVEFPNLGIIAWQMGTSWYTFPLTELN